MPLPIDIIEVISNIVINIISNDLDSIKGNFILSFKIKVHNKKTKKWIREFINENDGTFLTTSTFERYLKYQKPIEKIHDYVFELDYDNLDKATFISECVRECKAYFTANQKSFVPSDERLLKDFYNKLLNIFISFSNKQLSISDKRIIQETKRGNKKLLDKIDERTRPLPEIIDYLKNKDQITNPDILQGINNYINKDLWNGEFESVFNLLPLIERKSDDLENAIKIKLYLLSTYKCLQQDVIKSFSSIDDLCLHNDVARLLILHYFDDIETLSKIKLCIKDDNLSSIVECIINENTDKFFQLEIKQKNNANIYEFKLEEYFKDEQWLVNRICLLFLRRKTMLNSDLVFSTLIKENTTFFDNLILIEQEINRVILSFYNSEKSKQDSLSEVVNKLLKEQYKVEKYNEKAQLIYYDTLTKALMLSDSNKLLHLYPNIPLSIQSNPKIKAINIYIKSLNEQIDERELIDFCVKSEQYWVLNSYLSKNIYDDSSKFIEFIGKYPSVLKAHPVFFFNYYNTIKQSQGIDKAKGLLNEYENMYSEHLEYWIELYAISKEDKSDLVDSIFEKWDNDKLSLLNLYTEIDFINILVAEQRYTQALAVILKLETLGLSVPEILRTKAKILINLDRYLDAFQIFLSIFEYYSNDAYVIGEILEIAISFKREVPEEVLNNAIKTDISNLLTYVAMIYEKSDKLDESLQLATKSLMLSEDDRDFIYGYYFGLLERVRRNELQQITVTNNDTAFTMQKDDVKKTYCIHRNNILPEEQYVHHNATHIHRDTAIRMGLFRKSVNSKVTIDGIEYVITEIIPLELFLFRVCLNTLVNNGSVKQFSIRTDAEDKDIVGDFITQIKKYIPTKEMRNELLSQYNDMSKLPLPLYSLSKLTNLTYQEFIFVFLNDKSYYYREMLLSKSIVGEQFVLSFSALVILYKLNVSIEILTKKDIVISASTIQEIADANQQILENNNRDNVSKMDFIEDKPYLYTTSEEDKQYFMQQATNFKKYAQQIKTEDNINDIAFPELKNSNYIELLGICDYDCISIAQNSNRVLVNSEPIMSFLSYYDGYNFLTVGIIDFIVELDVSIDDLFEYMNKLVDFRFVITLTKKSFNYIVKKYDEITDDNVKENLLESWINYLSSIQKIDDDYKVHFSNNLTEVLRKVYKSPSDIQHPIYHYLFVYYMKYNNLKLEFDKDSSGNLDVKLISTDNAN